MVHKRKPHGSIEVFEETNKRDATELKNGDAFAPTRKQSSAGGVLTALRRWPIAGLNLKRERVNPRKISL